MIICEVFSSSANSLKIHPTLVRMRQYRYNPLFQKGYAIRVLQLLPSRDKSNILRGKLIEYLFEDIDSTNHGFEIYEALSYVWGGEEKPKSIIITDSQNDGNQEVSSELPITQNLYGALLRLRHCQFSRILWVDAVGIDQTNDEEKEHQIQLMPLIYARARCVLVWLGEAQDDSDMVLESIQAASRSFLQPDCDHTPTTQPMDHLQQGILKLLSRPWFHRMWILQEIGAARHVAIICGLTEIDGHAFSLGLDSLMTTWKIPLCSVTFLMRGAVFRPRRLSRKQARFSLDICSLSELIDQYHIHETTIRHDKVYALLGMSSDDISAAGIEPDYKLSWEELMQRLVRFLLGNRVTIDTTDNPEVAIIIGKGCLLGVVSSIKTAQGWETEVDIDFTANRDTPEERYGSSTSCSLPSLPKPIKRGDLVCLLEGAQKPIIIRPCKGHFTVVMIGAVSRRQSEEKLSDLVRLTKRFSRDLLFTWDWGNPLVELQGAPACNFTRSSNKSGLARRLNDFSYLWNVALVLRDAKKHKKAKRVFNEATEGCKAILEMVNLRVPPENLIGLTPLAFAAKNGYAEFAGMLLAGDRNSLNLEDSNGQMPLSHAAQSGHVALVKLLLESGHPEVIATDSDGKTPLSWAAAYGHEDVVQLLLKTAQVNVNASDREGQTPLLRAAENGHEGVVKLLLEVDQIDVNTHSIYGWTPLLKAAERGCEGIVRLLLKADQIDVNRKAILPGRTALLGAAEAGWEGVVKLLLEAEKIDVNDFDHRGQTILLKAAERGWEGIVKLLLKMDKINVNAKDRCYRTPLSKAAEFGHELVVKMLLDAKADVDSQDENDRTPQWFAAKNGHKAIITLLRGGRRCCTW